MTTTAWCSLCADPTEHEAHPAIPYGMTCKRCGHVRVDRNRHPREGTR